MNSGYTQFPNSLFDFLLSQSSALGKREIVILLLVIRHTIGWHRQSAKLSCRYIEQATGLAAGHVSSALKQLEAKEFLAIDRSDLTAVISLHERVTKTVTVTESVTDEAEGCYRIGNGSVTETVTEVLPNRSQKCYRNGNKQIKERKIKKPNKEEASWLLAEEGG